MNELEATRNYLRLATAIVESETPEELQQRLEVLNDPVANLIWKRARTATLNEIQRRLDEKRAMEGHSHE